MKLFWVGIDRSVSVGGPTFPWKRRGQVTIRSTLINPSACDLYLRDFERMRGLPSQNARILRRSSFGASRFNYLLICYPYYVHSELVERLCWGPHVSVEAPWTSHYSININQPLRLRLISPGFRENVWSSISECSDSAEIVFWRIETQLPPHMLPLL